MCWCSERGAPGFLPELFETKVYIIWYPTKGYKLDGSEEFAFIYLKRARECKSVWVFKIQALNSKFNLCVNLSNPPKMVQTRVQMLNIVTCLILLLITFGAPNVDCKKNDNLDLILLKVLADRNRNSHPPMPAPGPVYVPIYIPQSCPPPPPPPSNQHYPLYVPMWVKSSYQESHDCVMIIKFRLQCDHTIRNHSSWFWIDLVGVYNFKPNRCFTVRVKHQFYLAFH